MRTEALSSFVTLVRAGSYPAAAELLFLSPTTVHGHIRSLEEELQARLIEWKGRNLHLTEAGSRAFVFAERMLQELAQLDQDVSGISRPGKSILRIVSLHGPSVHVLPPAMRRFAALRPDVQVSVRATGVGECFAALASGQAQLAVLNDLHLKDVPRGFAASTLYEDRLVLVARTSLLRSVKTPLEQLPLALQPRTSAYRQYLERWAREENILLNVQFEHSSFDSLVNLALNADCVAMTGEYVARLRKSSEDLSILDLPSLNLQRKIIAVHPHPLEGIPREFVESVQSYSFEARQPSFGKSE